MKETLIHMRMVSGLGDDYINLILLYGEFYYKIGSWIVYMVFIAATYLWQA